jgi:glutaconate CoA-transferase subunit B
LTQAELPYTNKELMAAFVASEIMDAEAVSVGASLPVCRAGILLAHLTHAPNLKVQISFTITNLRNVEVLPAFEFITDWRAGRWAEFYYNHDIGPDLYKRRRQAIFFIGGLQIDAYGNSNLIGIGPDFNHMKMRGPGGVGTASMGTNIGRYYLYVNSHNKQTLTEKLDYRSCVGFAEGGADAREKLHLPGSGPRFCITPLCIFDFEEQSKRMRIKSVHPGVTVDQVLANTGFKPIVPDHVPTTPGPTEEQVRLLRGRIDPEGVLRRP